MSSASSGSKSLSHVNTDGGSARASASVLQCLLPGIEAEVHHEHAASASQLVLLKYLSLQSTAARACSSSSGGSRSSAGIPRVGGKSTRNASK
jgi:hypothetical protein